MKTNIPTAHQPVNREKLLLVLAVTLVFSVMNASIFNVVLPVIGAEFHLAPSALSWISTGYMIVYAIGSVTYGKLADKYRLKDLLTFGLAVFALGSLVGLIATEYWMIILGRVLQAAGASVIPATGMIIPVRYFPPEKRGRALGTLRHRLSPWFGAGPYRLRVGHRLCQLEVSIPAVGAPAAHSSVLPQISG
jgi:MFS transporter, DHA2 family, metal-tetracycline-proton antiporter